MHCLTWPTPFHFLSLCRLPLPPLALPGPLALLSLASPSLSLCCLHQPSLPLSCLPLCCFPSFNPPLPSVSYPSLSLLYLPHSFLDTVGPLNCLSLLCLSLPTNPSLPLPCLPLPCRCPHLDIRPWGAGGLVLSLPPPRYSLSRVFPSRAALLASRSLGIVRSRHSSLQRSPAARSSSPSLSGCCSGDRAPLPSRPQQL